MSLKQDLEKLVASCKEVINKMPLSQERRGLEIAFGKVSVALSNVSEEAALEEVKEEVVNTTEEELVPLGSTTPFSDEDVDRIYNGEQPEG